MQSNNWLFTSFDDEDYEQIFSNQNITYLGYGNEVTRTGRLHRQGYLQVENKLRRGGVSELFRGNPHLEAAKGTDSQNHTYITKEGDFTEFGIRKFHGGARRGTGPKKRKFAQIAEDIDEDDEATHNKHGNAGVSEKKGLRKILRKKKIHASKKMKMEALNLNDRQNFWLEKIENQNDRQITWVWDQDGGAGKTTFTRWLKYMRGAITLAGGKAADMACMISAALDDGNEGEYFVIDISRDREDYFSYATLEKIKDGDLPDPKYKSEMIEFDEAKIIVMANFAPNLSKMTHDRWDVIQEQPPTI